MIKALLGFMFAVSAAMAATDRTLTSEIFAVRKSGGTNTVSIKNSPSTATNWSLFLPSSVGSSGLPLVMGTAGTTSWSVLGLGGGGTGATTKAAAFDALSPMTASGDIIYGGASGTGTVLPRGSDGTFLTLSSGIPTWASVTVSETVTSQSTTYTALTTDNTIIASGASWTLTLYTAVGNSGRRLKIIHGGTSLSQIYTINTNSGQTIGGIASGSYKLYTNGESLEIQSNGTNWIILNHFTKTQWVDAGALVVTATTTNPTKATTREVDRVLWRREGNMAHVRMELSQNSGTGGAAGAGDYLFAMPTNLTIDTTYVTAYTTVGSPFLRAGNVGNFSTSQGTSSYPAGQVTVYDSTHVRFGIFTGSAAVMVTAAQNNLADSNLSYGANFMVPIVGWQP
jgi:hypothetical protein